MTRTKRLVTVSLASAALAAATLLTASPANADYREACRVAIAEYQWWNTVGQIGFVNA